MKYILLAPAIIGITVNIAFAQAPLVETPNIKDQASELVKLANESLSKGDKNKSITFCEAAINLDKYCASARLLLNQIDPYYWSQHPTFKVIVETHCDFGQKGKKAEQDAAANP
jgi:hypothetical protein